MLVNRYWLSIATSNLTTSLIEDDTGRVVVMDFGIAKLLGYTASSIHSQWRFISTLTYGAPRANTQRPDRGRAR